MRSFAALPAQIFGFFWWRGRVWGAGVHVWLWHRLGRALCPSPPSLCRELAPGRCWRQFLLRFFGFFFLFLFHGDFRIKTLKKTLPSSTPSSSSAHSQLMKLFITPSVSTRGKSYISHMCKLFFASQGSYLTSFSYFKWRVFLGISPCILWQTWCSPSPSACGVVPKSLWNTNFCTARGSWFNARMPCNTLRNAFCSSWTHSSACKEEESLLWADSR